MKIIFKSQRTNKYFTKELDIIFLTKTSKKPPLQAINFAKWWEQVTGVCIKITVVGVGYVGLATALLMVRLKNNVICIDLNEKKIYF